MEDLEPDMDGEITIKTKADSDDENPNVLEEHLSPQTLLETPDGSMVTYRILHVEDQEGENDSSVPMDAASDISGGTIVSNQNQIYVIGNSTDLFSTTTSKNVPIAPRSMVVADLPIAAPRDERRRATHNEVERRRRDKINNWITKLSKILPDVPEKPAGNYEGNSKGGILARAFEYILELQCSETKLDSCLKENKKLAQAVQSIKVKNSNLERENRELKEILKRHGIEVLVSNDR